LFAEADARGYVLSSGYERATGGAANYRQGQRHLDFYNAAARAWWWAAHQELVRLGVGGWWLDGGEGPPATARLAGGDGTLLHNMYDRMRHQAFAEGEAATRPDQRVFLLCRSGAAGMQRFGASTWSGDVNNDFPTLEAQVPLGLNTGLSGVPYWGTDVGGFFHAVPETGELYARWFQLGAFTPIFRSHGWVWREHVPWAHGPEVESICRRYAELRYRLLPHTYTLAWQAHTLGLPLMRPLVLNYPDDPRTWTLDHQYLWGDDLLVAPVTREGATAWPVYVPRGSWYDFWTGQRHEGPTGVTLAAPIDRLPLAGPRRRDRADGAGRAVHGRAPAGRADAADLSRGNVALRAVRGRWAHERVSARPLRADTDRVRRAARSSHGARRGPGGRGDGRGGAPPLPATAAQRSPRRHRRRRGRCSRAGEPHRSHARLVDGRRWLPLYPAARAAGAHRRGDACLAEPDSPSRRR
jgi:Glycosyl hydrolases family 31